MLKSSDIGFEARTKTVSPLIRFHNKYIVTSRMNNYISMLIISFRRCFSSWTSLAGFW